MSLRNRGFSRRDWLQLSMASALGVSISECFPKLARAAQEAKLNDQQKKDLLKSYSRIFASKCNFALDEERRLTMIPKPVMTWTGQERKDFTSGDVFIWQRDGRAEVIGCIGSVGAGIDRRSIFQEYHALTKEPLHATTLAIAGKWSPRTPGVELKPMADDMPPATTAVRRLSQMRRLAARFQPYMLTSERKEERLRLLPQPIFRFNLKRLEQSNTNVVDGAIFAYVWTIGTDPELLVLIECHKIGEKLHWLYAPIRFTYRQMRLDYEAQEVWDCAVDSGKTMRGPYITTGGGFLLYDQIRREVQAFQKIKGISN